MFKVIVVLAVTNLVPSLVTAVCKKRSVAAVDEKWLLKGAVDGGGWHIPMADETLGPEDLIKYKDVSVAKVAYTGKKNVCWRAPLFATGVQGDMQAESKCWYNNINQLDCIGYKPDNAIFALYPDKAPVRLLIGKTDGKTYFVSIACVNEGFQYMWFVASIKPNLPDNTRTEILQYLKREGMNVTNSKTSFRTNKLKSDDCANFKRDKKVGSGEGLLPAAVPKSI